MKNEMTVLESKKQEDININIASSPKSMDKECTYDGLRQAG